MTTNETTKPKNALAAQLREARSAAAKAGAQLQASYNELNGQYAALETEYRNILALPIPREELIERLREWVDAQRAAVMQRLEDAVSCTTQKPVTRPHATIGTESVYRVPAMLHQNHDLNKQRLPDFLSVGRDGSKNFNDFLFIGLLADPIKDAIADTIDALPDYPEAAMPKAKREARLKELSDEMDAVRGDMDELKAAAKAAGFTIRE